MNPINSANLLLLVEKGVREMKRIRPEEKDVLNPGEAIEYWNFSRRKFFDFIKQQILDKFLFSSNIWINI